MNGWNHVTGKQPAFPASLFRNLILLLFTLILVSGTSRADILKIGDAGTDLGTMRQLAGAYSAKYPDHTVKIIPKLTTEIAVESLLAADIQIAIGIRPPSGSEQAAGIKSIPYARTALVFASHQSLPVKDITLPTLRALYSGRQDNWADGQPVHLILRPEKTPITDILIRQFPDIWQSMKAAYGRTGTIIANSDQDAASRLERLKGAIGTVSLSSILGEGRALKPLSLNGVSPTPASIADGRYPLVMTLHFYLGPVNEDNPSNEAAMAFIRFTHSPEGRIILGNTGHQVLPAEDIGE